ncbi:MAG TPA: hypothetical protein PKD68_02030 [Candidatus Saccharibacteria bacterium]|nr:hypothetical protein [Candidatus Saccharibacteria bacterium]
MNDFLLHLPKEMENKDFIVLARDGGYGIDIDMVRDGETNFFDVLAMRDYKYLLLRVYLTSDQVLLAEENEELARFDNLVAVILDHDGKETDETLSIFLYIYTQVTTERAPAGIVRLWYEEPYIEGIAV